MFYSTFQEAVEAANKDAEEINGELCVCEWLTSTVFPGIKPIKFVVYLGWEEFALYCTWGHSKPYKEK